jgi:hypothetical protein
LINITSKAVKAIVVVVVVVVVVEEWNYAKYIGVST